MLFRRKLWAGLADRTATSTRRPRRLEELGRAVGPTGGHRRSPRGRAVLDRVGGT